MDTAKGGHRPDPMDNPADHGWTKVCRRCWRRVIEVWPENTEANRYLRHVGKPLR